MATQFTGPEGGRGRASLSSPEPRLRSSARTGRPTQNGPMAARVSSPTFVGRRVELDRLAAALDDARLGQPRVVLVGGEAGVGKTRLVRELERLAATADVRVLEGACLPLGGEGRPYGAVIEALRGLTEEIDTAELEALAGSGRAELARLMPELGSAGQVARAGSDGTAQGRLFEHLLRFLGKLAGTTADCHRARGPALGRPFHARIAGLPGPKPARDPGPDRGHVPDRRGSTPTSASDAAGRARSVGSGRTADSASVQSARAGTATQRHPRDSARARPRGAHRCPLGGQCVLRRGAACGAVDRGWAAQYAARSSARPDRRAQGTDARPRAHRFRRRATHRFRSARIRRRVARSPRGKPPSGSPRQPDPGRSARSGGCGPGLSPRAAPGGRVRRIAAR